MKRQIKVLVIDEDKSILEALKSEIQSWGFHLDGFSSVEKAVASFQVNQHDIVLLQYGLSSLSTESLLARLRAAVMPRWTPMVFLAQADQVDAPHDLMEFDGADMMLKPLSMPLLKAKLLSLTKLLDENRTDSGEQFRAVLDGTTDALVVVNQAGHMVEFNSVAGQIFGWERNDVLGWSIHDFMPAEIVDVHAEIFEDDKLASIWNARRMKVSGRDGRTMVMEVRFGFINLPTRRLCTITMRDVSEQDQASQYDALTQLPNRALFEERLAQLIAISNRYGKLLGVLFIDLDKFKEINDSHGHEAGDRVLQEIARRLNNAIRESDTLARLGGDEFVALLYDLRSSEDARIIAERFITSCQKPIVVNDRSFDVSASIGIAIYPDGARDKEVLLRQADKAMYHAKRAGGGRYSFFSMEINKAARQKQELEQGLEAALRNKNFFLVYQPQVNLRTKQIEGAEALIRWEKDGKVVPPNLFVPIAEETGLIVEIGEWVLREACKEAKTWWDRGLRGPNGQGLAVGVNLSVRQFNMRLPGVVFEILNETGLPPNLLNLEITESFLVQDIDQARIILEKLVVAGVLLSVDDFGTGYSCLAYLKELPVTTIKVDKKFVDLIHAGGKDLKMVSGIVTLAKSLEMRTLAEGVEKSEQVDALVALECDSCQGYLFSRPIRAPEFQRMLESSLPVAA
jgi:diguanylate cyclase (GGDEF)-like protein/PAS domain S-box-containing protein